MARRLSYSFYTKDWQTNDKVMFLTLEQRGFYRELIDFAMMNDNIIQYDLKVFCRKFSITRNKCNKLLNHLIDKKLIEISGDIISIPSCERRLTNKRNGSKGGKTTAKNGTPNGTPNSTPNKNLNTNKNINIKEKENLFNVFSGLYLKKDKMQIAKDVFMELDLETCKRIVEVVPRYNESKKDTETKYLPRATDWLNDKEYLTEYPKTPLELNWDKYNAKEKIVNLEGLIKAWNHYPSKRIGDVFSGDAQTHAIPQDYKLKSSEFKNTQYATSEVNKIIMHYLRNRENAKIEDLIENFDRIVSELDIKPKMTKEEFIFKYSK